MGDLVRSMSVPVKDRPATLLGGSSQPVVGLNDHGTTDPFRDRMFDFDQLNAVIGTPAMIAAGKAYEGSL